MRSSDFSLQQSTSSPRAAHSRQCRVHAPIIRPQPLLPHGLQPVSRDTIPTIRLRILIGMGPELRQLDKSLHLRQPILGDGDLERSWLDSRRRGQGTEWTRHGEMHFSTKNLTEYLLLISDNASRQGCTGQRGRVMCSCGKVHFLRLRFERALELNLRSLCEADEMTRPHL
jgi:hypothetical protein